MKWTKENMDHDGSFHRIVSDTGLEVCVYPVLFGFRVRSGTAGMGFYELDYCAGADHKAVEAIYQMVVAVLDKYGKYDVFPFQRRKPMYNDPGCAAELVRLSAGSVLIEVDFSDIHELKSKYLKGLWTPD